MLLDCCDRFIGARHRPYRDTKSQIVVCEKVLEEWPAYITEEPGVWVAADRLKGEALIAYGDILFRQHILDQLRGTDGDIVLAVDALWRERDPNPTSRLRDLVTCSTPFQYGYLDDAPKSLTAIGPEISEGLIHGEWIGLAFARDRGTEAIRKGIETLRGEGVLDRKRMSP